MPALANPRHEAFAQAIFQGLSQDPQPGLRTGASWETFSNGKAYKRAGYLPSNTNAADAAASRLLRKVKPILERVRELQAEANKRLQPKLDLSRERIGRRLDLASQLAENQGNAQAIVASELGIAKVFHRFTDDDKPAVDFASANSMQDIGRKLLQSIGFREPDDVSIAAAIEANDAFIERLEAIRDEAGQTIDDDD
jgi:hypothetical protein